MTVMKSLFITVILFTLSFFTFLSDSCFAQNDVRWIFEGQQARTTYLQLLDEAQSFIHISNLALDSDPLGREIADKLIERAKHGIEVRLLIDNITRAPHTGPYGIVWLTSDLVENLRQSGVEVRFNYILQKRSADTGLKGLYGRHHRKFLIVDGVDATGAKVLKTFLGSRVLSAISFEDVMNSRPHSFLEKWLGVGEGPTVELSFLLSGPINQNIQAKFLETWAEYGDPVDGASRDVDYFPKSDAVKGGTAVKMISHQGLNDDYTMQALLTLINDPNAHDVYIFNSYHPAAEVKAAMIEAVKNGKKVFWISGTPKREIQQRIQEMPDLIKAGVQVYIHPQELQIKLYYTDRFLLTGSMNINELSQLSTEDLFIFPRSDRTGPVELWSQQLLQESFHINTMLELLRLKYQRSEDWKNIYQFIQQDILKGKTYDEYEDREHDFVSLLSKTSGFLAALPFY